MLENEAVLVVINLSDSTFVNPKVSLASSSLPAGEYLLTDLFSGANAKPVSITPGGGFDNLVPSSQILPFGTLIFHLGKP